MRFLLISDTHGRLGVIDELTDLVDRIAGLLKLHRGEARE